MTPESFDLVVHNGTVVTVNDSFDIIAGGVVCVRGDRIANVAAAAADGSLPSASAYVDAGGGIIMPGLVNTHCHAPMTLFRGLADDLPLDRWLNDHIFPAESAFIDAASAGAGARLACAEMLLGGTTTCCDGYFHEDAVAAAFAACGMRAVAAQGIIDYPAPGVPDPGKNLAAARDYVEKWRDRAAAVRPSLFCHSPYTCSEQTLQRAKSLAREFDVLFQIHVCETRAEVDRCLAEHGVTPIGYLDRLGVLDETTLLVHCVWLAETDIALIASRRCAVSHNPESNMKLGAGIAPVAKLLASGVTVGLGTDGCASNNTLDLFRSMAAAAKLHKVAGKDPTALDARTVVGMATREGARAIGLGDATGSLEAGKLADLMVVNIRKPHMTPLFHPESQLVYAAGAGDVETVVVGGRVVVDRRRMLTLDVASAMQAARRLARRIRPNQTG